MSARVLAASLYLCLGSACASLYLGNGDAKAGYEASGRRPLGGAERALCLDGGLGVSEAALLAVENSLSLKASRQALDARRGAWRLGLRAFFPSLSVSASEDDTLSPHGRDGVTRTLSLSLRQALWDGGRLAAGRALEAAELDLATEALEREERALGEAAVEAYRQSQAASARLAIRRESLVLAEAERAFLEKERRLGLAKEADLVEADLSLASMRLAVTEAELAASMAAEELAEALGLESLPELSDPLPSFWRPFELDEDALVAAALERSHELASARLALTRRRAEARLARLSWLPRLSLEASGRVYGESLPLHEADWSLTLELGFSSPALSATALGGGGSDLAGRIRARRGMSLEPLGDPSQALLASTTAEALMLEEERYGLAVTGLDRRVRSATVAYRSAARLLEIRERALALGEERLRLAGLGASLGRATRTERLEAELKRAGLAIEVVDAVLGLIGAERRLEALLDLAPGSLARFLERL